jgi:hypothetical protein
MRVLRILGTEPGWNDRLHALRKQFGDNTPSKATLKRYLAAVRGVDPVNFAPALIPDYQTCGAPPAEITDDAWSLFMTIIRDAAATFPLKTGMTGRARYRTVEGMGVAFIPYGLPPLDCIASGSAMGRTVWQGGDGKGPLATCTAR